MHRAAFATAHQIALDTRNAKGIRKRKMAVQFCVAEREKSLSNCSFPPAR